VSLPSSLQIKTTIERRRQWRLLIFKQKQRNKNTKEKKSIKNKKNAKKGRNLPFLHLR
jgi:hypothetical protein